jgi:hypothetical protein
MLDEAGSAGKAAGRSCEEVIWVMLPGPRFAKSQTHRGVVEA